MRYRIEKIMADVFSVDIDKIGDNFTPESADIWTSQMHMNLIIALEEEFGIEFDENDIPEMLSLAKIESIIAAK